MSQLDYCEILDVSCIYKIQTGISNIFLDLNNLFFNQVLRKSGYN